MIQNLLLLTSEKNNITTKGTHLYLGSESELFYSSFKLIKSQI